MGKPQIERMKKIIGIFLLIVCTNQIHAQIDSVKMQSKLDTLIQSRDTTILRDSLQTDSLIVDSVQNFKLKKMQRLLLVSLVIIAKP